MWSWTLLICELIVALAISLPALAWSLTVDVLLIWQNVPDSTCLYYLRNVDPVDQRRLTLLHGKFANVANNDEMSNEDYIWMEQLMEKNQDSKIYDGDQPNCPPVQVTGVEIQIVVCGFVL